MLCSVSGHGGKWLYPLPPTAMRIAKLPLNHFSPSPTFFCLWQQKFTILILDIFWNIKCLMHLFGSLRPHSHCIVGPFTLTHPNSIVYGQIYVYGFLSLAVISTYLHLWLVCGFRQNRISNFGKPCRGFVSTNEFFTNIYMISKTSVARK